MSDLSSRAMLVSLNIRAWRGVAADRKLAESTEEAAHAETGSMTVIKELTPRHLLHPIKAAARIARQEHHRMTVPGLHRGQQLLASTMFLDYSQYMSELRDAFDKRVNDFLEIYPDIVKAAPSRLGDAYRKDDFPSPKQMRDYFGFNLKFSPVPKITDWRLDDLSQADIETIRQETEAEVQEMFSGAIAEVYERSADVLSRILKQLKSDDGIIRKPTLDNVKEMAELVLKMNITNDEGLNRLGLQMMEIFADHEAAEMRGDADLRKKIAAAAEKLMKGIPNG